jgi:acyl carrier protein
MPTADLDVLALFKDAAWQTTGRHFDDVTLESAIASLGLDSVALLETLGLCEERLGVRFEDEDLRTLTTIRDLEALVGRARRAA